MKFRSTFYFILFLFFFSSLLVTHMPSGSLKWSIQKRIKKIQTLSFTDRKLRVYSPSIGNRFILPKFTFLGSQGEIVKQSYYPSSELHKVKERFYFFSKTRWANFLFSSSTRMEGNETYYSREMFRNLSRQFCKLFPNVHAVQVEKEIVEFEAAFSRPIEIPDKLFFRYSCERSI